ncbi:MAG: hypothetical protein ACXWLS_14025, partial [Myxococcaceae bacterium]
VRVNAVQHLLGLVRLRASPAARSRLDDLDVSRRVEAALPEIGRAIGEALERPVPEAARALLAIGQGVFPDLIPPGVPRALEQVVLRAETAARTLR